MLTPRFLPIAACLLLAAAPAPAQDPRGVEIQDQLDVIRVDRRLLAVSSAGDAILETELEVGEEVELQRRRGLVGVVATSRRLLGVTTRSSTWQPLRYRVNETDPPSVEVADRLALASLATRVVALGAEGGTWVEKQLGPQEVVLSLHAEDRVGAVLTSRRVLGFSTSGGGFVELPLSSGDALEEVSILDGVVTVKTEQRVLIFRDGARRWSEHRRRLGN